LISNCENLTETHVVDQSLYVTCFNEPPSEAVGAGGASQ